MSANAVQKQVVHLPLINTLPPEENIYDEVISSPFDLSEDEEFTESAGSYPFEINPEVDESTHDYRYADLQDQLMAVVMENERLASELDHVKYDQLRTLTNKLQEEQEKNHTLERQINSKPTVPQRRKIAQSRREILYKSKSMGNLANEPNAEASAVLSNDLDTEVGEDALLNPDITMLENNIGLLRSRFSMRLRSWLNDKYEELKNDFSEVNHEIDLPDQEGEQLNPFKLRKNLLRFGNFMDPAVEVLHSVISLTRWENPAVSFMAFIIYMIVIYKDWLLSSILLCMVSVFFFTYLRHKGWSFGNEVENINDVTNAEIEKDLSIREQIAVLIVVGRRSQNITAVGSDLCEKLRNVLLWREPELTKPIFILCGMTFVSSLIFPTSFLLKMAGLGVGIHLFIIQYIFSRFPRFNRKYNKVEEFVSHLKNDLEYEKEIKKIKKDMKKTSKLSRSVSALPTTSSTPRLTPVASSPLLLSSVGSSEVVLASSFHDKFNLPVSETPLLAWKNGRRCILVNKDKILAVGFKIGRMYLTNNYLCFERSKTETNKNMIIPLESVKSISKAKLYQWVPGGGKAIEIKVKGTSKALCFVFQVHIFGPIINRDEAFDSIMEVGFNNEYVWSRQNEITGSAQ